LSDRISITRAIHATPFANAPNVVVAYPQYEDWKDLYKTPPVRSGFATLTPFDPRYLDPRYLMMKRNHEDDALKHLAMMQGQATGRAVLAGLIARRSYSVYILPSDFRPPRDRKDKGAVTDAIDIPQTAAERAQGRNPPSTRFCHSGACVADLDRTAQSVDVYFTPGNFRGNHADGVLVHELVHALRIMSGLLHDVPMGRGYGDSEEFYATTIEAIYRSEKRLALYDYQWKPLDPAAFFDPEENARMLLYMLRDQQGSLFDALANVKADFNPFKVLFDERRRIMGY
jgi:hypothetical protein